MKVMHATKDVIYYHVDAGQHELDAVVKELDDHHNLDFKMLSDQKSIRMIETRAFTLISKKPEVFELLTISSMQDRDGRYIAYHYDLPVDIADKIIELLPIDHQRWMRRQSPRTGVVTVDVTDRKKGLIQ